MDCNCKLNDASGSEALKTLYSIKGAGGVSFTEKISNNIPVMGVGLGLGAFIGYIVSRPKKLKRR